MNKRLILKDKDITEIRTCFLGSERISEKFHITQLDALRLQTGRRFRRSRGKHKAIIWNG